MLIKNFAQILNNKIWTNELNSCSYVSTENILTNFGGVCESSNVPKGKCTEFHTEDILISNIRPYFKKFWFAKFNGGCSNDVLAIRPNKQCISRYLYYALCSNKFVDLYVASCKGTKMPRGNKEVLLNYNLKLPSLSEQQHIVDTIGSVDDLIEKIEEKLNKIKEYGGLIFNKTIDCELIDLLKIAKFEKGKEIGSANYLDKQEANSVPYIRVGNLLNGEYDTYVVNSDCPQCDYEDILIAFDGAPGRNIIGLKGYYSSGVQKVVCDKENKGYIYFYINSELCQNTIKVHSQGTTILHASKSINELKIPIISNDIKNLLNSLFNEMVSLIKQKKKLKKEKDLLLKKYFG